MNIKERYFFLIEMYLNELKKELVEGMYGKGSKIKIRTITEMISKKMVLVDAVIILGDVITEEVMNEDIADVLIQDGLMYFFPNYSVKVMITWDS